MAKKFKYAYAIIERESNLCFQTLKTNNAEFTINNDAHYSFAVDIAAVGELLGKYFYNSQWWKRVWGELDENGLPAEDATYTDIPYTVGGEE